jgi:hypothetical protein
LTIGALNQPSAEPSAGCGHDRHDDDGEDSVTAGSAPPEDQLDAYRYPLEAVGVILQ